MTCDRKVVIFCSSSQSGIDPKYDSAARELVRALVERDYTVVSGGTRKGTMVWSLTRWLLPAEDMSA